MQEVIMSFFEARETAYDICYNLYGPDDELDGWGVPSWRRLLDPIYSASLGGLIDCVRMLAEQGADVNAESGRFGNAL